MKLLQENRPLEKGKAAFETIFFQELNSVCYH